MVWSNGTTRRTAVLSHANVKDKIGTSTSSNVYWHIAQSTKQQPDVLQLTSSSIKNSLFQSTFTMMVEPANQLPLKNSKNGSKFSTEPFPKTARKLKNGSKEAKICNTKIKCHLPSKKVTESIVVK